MTIDASSRISDSVNDFDASAVVSMYYTITFIRLGTGTEWILG